MTIQNKINLNKFRLQYITNENQKYSHLESAKLALDGGCKWVQLRIKTAIIATTDISCVLEVATQLNDICKKYNATFIINDNVHIARQVNADGVHLGKNDMPIQEARNILSADKIIGATANNMKDIENAIKNGADYIGLGPYRFTTTKQNLSKLLGIQGYKEIFSKLHNIRIPVVAIGGIELEDVEELMQTDISGIAVSGGILNSNDIVKRTSMFLEKLKAIT